MRSIHENMSFKQIPTNPNDSEAHVEIGAHPLASPGIASHTSPVNA